MKTVSRLAARGTIARLRAVRLALWLAVALALPACSGVAQQTGSGSPFTIPPRGFPQQGSATFGSDDPSNPLNSEKRVHMMNVERQKALVADTNRLFALATELNNEIAKSHPGELSPEQLRKVAEIEKLAHSVRDKMVMSVRSPAMNMDTPVPFMPPLH